MKRSPAIYYIQGIILILLGIAAMIWPNISSIAVEIIIGWLFLIGGIFKLVKSIRTKASFLYYLLSVAYIVAGAFLLVYPIYGLTTLTLAIALLFISQGIIEILWSFSRPQNKLLFLLSGLLSIFLGEFCGSNGPRMQAGS
jgi:uncharacterized membrane protein HdeD (DUF308 family)